MAILVNASTRIICQGITGRQGSFHCERAIASGTNIVGGVRKGKGGSRHLGVPVFDSVDEAVEVADVGRKGAADLEKSVDSIKNYFFKDGVQMVVDGYSLDEITEIMETRIEYREKRENVQKSMLKSMGDLAPAWGMVGTLIGLVLMLAGFGGEGGADNLGGGMAAALITTLYGAVFANLFFLPMADKMGNKTTQTSMSAALLVEAARLIHQKKHPLIVREKLNSFIPPGEWKSEG